MKSLKEVKNTMSVASIAGSDLSIDGQTIGMSPKFISDAIIEGVYRQLSMETAGQDTKAIRDEILSRFGRGYLKASDEKKATKPIEVKGGKKVIIERYEVRGWIADNAPEKLAAFEASTDKSLELAMGVFYTPLLYKPDLVEKVQLTTTYAAISAIDALKKEQIKEEELQREAEAEEQAELLV